MSLSDEEKALFRQMMEEVKPLKKTNKIVEKKIPRLETRIRKKPVYEPIKPKEDPYLSDYYHQPMKAESILSFSVPSLPAKRFKELKQGKIPLRGRLDLHGFKAEAAKEALINFIDKQYQQNCRSLLIIHGKGSPEGDAPILKNLVNRWLPQFNEVLAFHSALPKDGGAGAVYLLLKSNNQINEDDFW